MLDAKDLLDSSKAFFDPHEDLPLLDSVRRTALKFECVSYPYNAKALLDGL